MNSLETPFVPKKACSQEQADPQKYFKLKKQVSPQATNPGKKNDNKNNQMEELSLNPAEEGLLRGMRAEKFRTLSALKLREPSSKEADRLATKISPMDYRLKREQDAKKLKRFKQYRHILHAPKGSSTLSACIPSHPWPEFSQPLTCLHCNLTTDHVNIHQFLPTINIPCPKSPEVRILHGQDLCPYHDYYLLSGCSLGYHELLALSVFQQWGISFGTECGRGPGSREVLLPDRHFDEKRSHFRYFIDRMREEVVEKRGHLVTTEADLKLGTFLGEGTGSGNVFETCVGEEGRKNLGAIGDGRPVVKGKETGKEEEDDEEDEEAMEDVGPAGGDAPLTAPE
ncbi:hypothetical protein GE21DRAFT_4200 [Neurospora crassa]|uniref:Uncharacterized protein n=1 Tax=Neurospora crassa (strain ATCC 24698 / 74-OR23-1A / CBS 708.71 / DSM 1257 / FGSC 987) TaxID=367110 RepID=Q7SBT4_NEUCR|nr:hypothetical protein NCU06221 [Neurospora crassa OR74A]EAA33836.1 hypothetical protein NCU06221 [Neurospora crassa OR74A]KHE87052.1 hypothetical protein GE21DRAFT_4200 [Neurospora crassa]|eukprot:XP_963072.1 hypothetical protein NCU06221 [Neurospora crassa OR74A]